MEYEDILTHPWMNSDDEESKDNENIEPNLKSIPLTQTLNFGTNPSPHHTVEVGKTNYSSYLDEA